MWRKVNTVHYIQRQIHVTIEYPECSLETSLGVHFINVNCAFIHLEKQKKNQVRRMARKCMKPGKSSGIRRHSEVVDPGKDASELQSGIWHIRSGNSTAERGCTLSAVTYDFGRWNSKGWQLVNQSLLNINWTPNPGGMGIKSCHLMKEITWRCLIPGKQLLQGGLTKLEMWPPLELSELDSSMFTEAWRAAVWSFTHVTLLRAAGN